MEYLNNLIGIIAVVAVVIAINNRNRARRNETRASQAAPSDVQLEDLFEDEWSEVDDGAPCEPDLSHEGACAFSLEGFEPPEHDHGGTAPHAVEGDDPVRRQRLTAAKVREAFILSEVLAPPVSMRRRPQK